MEYFWTACLVLVIFIGRIQSECFLEDLEDPGIRAIKSRLEDEKAKRLLLQSDVDALMLKVEKLGKKSASSSGVCCPDRWVAFRGSCYQFGDVHMNFDSAVRYCQRLGGHVVQVDSSDENHFLEDFVRSLHGKGVYYWIGLTDIEEEGVWVWNSSQEPLTYIDWHNNEPNGDRGENCVTLELTLTGQIWIDVNCARKELPICERS